ncbi:xylose isomerase [Paenibacillus sp. FSL H7-0326]|uniref:sugar phosphate isomerase/epimerase family protein n=1 Tax=Paenibacillus sp. FSL H7-0326 TaxID=1921144 RepID=UPI00096C414F|nr:sugar phosphate isomerase/epimerase [Paenibacillus sp. FSL H7-0326]OMC67611.1 xylose isomerase [Paenibacillus sp. FSL H7-0326]
MKLLSIKALWGMEGTYEEQFARVAAVGYVGVEAALPPAGMEEKFQELLDRYGLAYIAQVFTGEDHANSFYRQVEQAARFGPVKIVSHSARDCMSEDEQDRFFASALETETKFGIAVGHETHRQRAMFTPWTTARILRKFPELRITADFSHWMNVCESYLEDQEEQLSLAMERTIHIHARVGFPEGPQVPHPGAPEYSKELELHLGWWRTILNRQAAEGAAQATFTAEFGPPGYMPTLPFTNVPVADLWEVNRWMSERVLEHCQAKKMVSKS